MLASFWCTDVIHNGAGAVVEYSRKKETYFYKEPFDFFEEFDYLNLSRKGNEQFLKELLKYYLSNKENSADRE